MTGGRPEPATGIPYVQRDHSGLTFPTWGLHPASGLTAVTLGNLTRPDRSPRRTLALIEFRAMDTPGFSRGEETRVSSC
jgi:hypothetical protein